MTEDGYELVVEKPPRGFFYPRKNITVSLTATPYGLLFFSIKKVCCFFYGILPFKRKYPLRNAIMSFNTKDEVFIKLGMPKSEFKALFG
jgi:hypothetical protein